MLKKILQFLGGAGVAIGMILLLAIPFFLAGWYENHFDSFYPWFVAIPGIGIWVVIFSIVASLVPRFRKFTGSTLVFCSWAFGAALWLVNLYVSLVTLGRVWTIVGIFCMGIGVFVTASIGLFLSDRSTDVWLMLFYLAIIYGLRMFGLFIASKYRSTKKSTRPPQTMGLNVRESEHVADRKLIALISTKGKTAEKVSADTMGAIQKYYDTISSPQKSSSSPRKGTEDQN